MDAFAKPRFSWLLFVGLVVGGLAIVRIAIAVWMYFFVTDFSADGTYGVLTPYQQFTIVGVVVVLAAAGALFIGRRVPSKNSS